MEEKLFANRESIHTAMIYASTMKDHKILFEMYNPMVHLKYVWENWTWLEEWTDYIFDWMVAVPENTSMPLDKTTINTLVNIVG